MKAKLTIVLLTAVTLVGCATRIPQPAEAPPLIAPDTRARNLFIRGRLTLSASGHSIESDAVVEVSPQSMTVVILGPTPRPWLQVQFDGDKLEVDEASEIRPYPLPPKRLIGDLQLALRRDLSAVDLGRFSVDDRTAGQRQREVRGPDGLFVRIHYEAWPPGTGTVTIQGPDQRYQLTYEPVGDGGSSTDG